MSKKEAEGKAFLDFSKRSDEAQQSSDPALVSQQQRSVLGRLVLAFANTPMQYTRLMKKAGQDLINGRGSFKENMSKIAYFLLRTGMPLLHITIHLKLLKRMYGK